MSFARRFPITALAAASFSLLAPVASAQMDCAWQASDNLVVVEVESIPEEGDWEAFTDNAGYTGASFYRWEGPNYFNNPGNGTLSYPFEVHEGGTWQMRIRNRHNHPDSTEENDCWTRMDGGPWIKTFSNGSGTVSNWTFKTNFELGGGFPTASYSLGIGRHLLEISGRSHNFMIDRIHFYHGGVPNPEDDNQPQSICGIAGSYCDASPNSTGFPTQMSALGSVSLSDDDFKLKARVVPNQPGLFYFGTQEASIPFGDGTRCVGGTTYRLNVMMPVFDALEANVPLTTGPHVGVIDPGDTFHFQAWYRDPAAGGSGFNLSDGLHVNFVP
ncbi:MAG: hypothetical protein ACI841_003159 [Planctomycetota bacterium]|jgi:hypothetical protein